MDVEGSILLGTSVSSLVWIWRSWGLTNLISCCFNFITEGTVNLSGKDLRNFKGREGEIPNVKQASSRKANQAQFRSPLSPLVPRGDSFSLWGTWLEDRSIRPCFSTSCASGPSPWLPSIWEAQEGRRNSKSVVPEPPSPNPEFFLDLQETLQQVNGWEQPHLTPILPTPSFLLLRRVFRSLHCASMRDLAVWSGKWDRSSWSSWDQYGRWRPQPS